jgi:hypothetical protein
VDAALAGVAGTQIEWAVVYDIGQGNAIGLCNEKGSVEAYSDLGGGVLGHAGTFPTALKNFCFTKTPPIILSHWDFDHWSSANRDPQSLQLTWIAPRQSVGPTHVALMTSIISAGGRLLLVPNTLPAKWRGQLYLELCAGKGRNHSGIALTLSQKAKGEGALMLFPGDARYPALPSFTATNDYLCVVAPHHGGDMRNRNVPYCANQPVSRLAYSYGQPNTYGHPAKVTRTDHDQAGWHDWAVSPGVKPRYVRETVDRASGQPGHILLSWLICTTPPPLPCGGSYCQLQAQQL